MKDATTDKCQLRWLIAANRVTWEDFKESIHNELDDEYVEASNALPALVERYNQKRLVAREFRQIRLTGEWRDPGKTAMESAFARILTDQITNDDPRSADFATHMVAKCHRHLGHFAQSGILGSSPSCPVLGLASKVPEASATRGICMISRIWAWAPL